MLRSYDRIVIVRDRIDSRCIFGEMLPCGQHDMAAVRSVISMCLVIIHEDHVMLSEATLPRRGSAEILPFGEMLPCGQHDMTAVTSSVKR